MQGIIKRNNPQIKLFYWICYYFIIIDNMHTDMPNGIEQELILCPMTFAIFYGKVMPPIMYSESDS